MKEYSVSGPHPSRFLTPPRDNEIRVLERDGRRWLQQWRTPPNGQHRQRAWVDAAELPWPRSNLRSTPPAQ